MPRARPPPPGPRSIAFGLIALALVANAAAWLFVLLRRRAWAFLTALLSSLSAIALYELVRSSGRYPAFPPVRAPRSSVRFPASPGMAEGGEDCIICLQPYAEGEACALLPCGHVFHARCMAEWDRPCPMKCAEGRAPGPGPGRCARVRVA